MAQNFDNQHDHDDDYVHPLLLPEAPRRLSRREALALFGGVGALGLLAGCGATTFSGGTAAGSTTTVGGGTSGSCAVIPSETVGPYPADGSNSSVDVLANSSIYRNDVRDSKTGIPLMLVLNLQNTNLSCEALTNAAVYIWHCDKDGAYSGYSSSQNGNHASERFCRGVQVSDASGQVSFTTIYPGWYAGRITHIHFQIFLNNDLNATPLKTSQLAFPQEVTSAVYGSSLYASRGQNTSVTSFARDNVFSDGTTYQMSTVTGSVASGLVATLNVGVAA